MDTTTTTEWRHKYADADALCEYPEHCSTDHRFLFERDHCETCGGTMVKVDTPMHASAILVGGTVPAHVPGAYPRLSCCGGPVTVVL